jgi:NAD(P)H-dependent flavin oxidoreductase YrpB (nitropropane dioxygenase family)
VARSPDGQAIARYDVSEPNVTLTGDLEALAHYAGQSAGLVDAITPAGTIVRALVEEAETILQRLAALSRPGSP